MANEPEENKSAEPALPPGRVFRVRPIDPTQEPKPVSQRLAPRG